MPGEPRREAPYGLIARQLRRGMVVPVLGAGVHMPNRPRGAEYKATTTDFYPSGTELAAVLADEVQFPAQDDHDLADLAKVASYYVEVSARSTLRGRLREIFDRTCTPVEPHRDVHTYLADLSAHTPLLIVTTNYDYALEDAFTRAGRPFHLVVHPTDQVDYANSLLLWRHGRTDPEPVTPNRLMLDLGQTTVIYKMHGTVRRRERKDPGREVQDPAGRDPPRAPPEPTAAGAGADAPAAGGNDPWDSYVITEDDYVEFLSRMAENTAIPPLFMHYFSIRHFLFLGYSLRDWNLRVVLRKLQTLLPILPEPVGPGTAAGLGQRDTPASSIRPRERMESWAIQFQPSVLERTLWEKRDVTIFDKDIGDFVVELRKR